MRDRTIGQVKAFLLRQDVGTIIRCPNDAFFLNRGGKSVVFEAGIIDKNVYRLFRPCPIPGAPFWDIETAVMAATYVNARAEVAKVIFRSSRYPEERYTPLHDKLILPSSRPSVSVEVYSSLPALALVFRKYLAAIDYSYELFESARLRLTKKPGEFAPKETDWQDLIRLEKGERYGSQ